MSDDHISASTIGETFRDIVSHMKGSIPVWEDFLSRGLKFHKQLEQTVLALHSFLDGLGKVSEVACRAKGGTNDVGAGLTSLVIWHKGQEMKMKELNSALVTKMLAPLHTRIEQWKKTTALMEREHDKEVQKSVKEIKEAARAAAKTQKSLESKLKKDKTEKATLLKTQLDRQRSERARLIRDTEEREKQHLTNAMLEERKWYCGFVAAYSKSLEVESSMYSDVDRLNTSLQDLGAAITQPTELPDIAKEFIGNWKIPTTISDSHTKHYHVPNTQGSRASLNSTHSHTSLSSAESHDISAPVHQGGASLMNSGPQAGPHMNTAAVPPAPPLPMSGPPLPMGGPPVPMSGPPLPTSGPPHINQAPTAPACNIPVPTQGPAIGGQFPQGQVPQTTPMFPPPPPGPPPSLTGPPTQCQPTTVVYQPPTPTGPPPHTNFSHLPPPPQANFPPAEYASISQRPLPPVPMSEAESMSHIPYARTSIVSVSPSEMSLASHQSSESSRSLSPPIGPAYSPSTSRSHLESVREVHNDPPMDFQAALLQKLRKRSNSAEKEPTAGVSVTLPRNMPPVSSTSRGPPVTNRPPRAPGRVPTRSASLRDHTSHQAYGDRSSPLLHNNGPTHPVHHVFNQNTAQQQEVGGVSSDSDHEDESAFAKALRLKKLKKSASINDRSAPSNLR